MSTVQTQEPRSKSPLAFSQKNAQVYVGSTLQMRAQGGTPLYHYSIESGEGEISDSGLFQAPLTVQTVRVKVTDEYQQVAHATIKVVELPKPDRTIDLTNLEFVTAKAQLTPSAEKYFNDNIQNLKDVRVKKVIVEGHTDSVGKDAYNLRLSRSRAKAIKERLAQVMGYSPDMVEAIGFGESRPIASNNTATGRQRNRRVILKVYYSK